MSTHGKIRLVSSPKRAASPSNTRLILGNYIADVLLNTRGNVTIYHWIVQQVGSPAIIQWGQEYTFNEAKAAAQLYLETLYSKGEAKRA
ncbi:MAG TPA: hypothetical protein VJA94_13490 [Candidatus Angelobacter sp.]